MKKQIKERFEAGQIVRVLAVSQLANTKIVEIAGHIGNIHGIWIDQEHGAVPHAQLELLLTACRAAGLDAFARVPPTDYATIMRPMEAGCSGIMAAQIRSLDEVDQVANWSKYPPQGTRGLFLGCAETSFGSIPPSQHIQQANRDRWLAIQIETAEAIERVDQIAAHPAVDWLFVGPSDLSCNLGVPGQFSHPTFVQALEAVAQAVKKVGKPWGTLAPNREFADTCRELGCQLFSIVGDLDLVKRGFQATQQMYSNLFSED